MAVDMGTAQGHWGKLHAMSMSSLVQYIIAVETSKTLPHSVHSFITSWFATYLVYCPPNDRTKLYISLPVSSLCCLLLANACAGAATSIAAGR